MMQQPLHHRVPCKGHNRSLIHRFGCTRAPPRCRWTTVHAAADLPVVEIPSSQEAAVTAATQALVSHLKPLLGTKGKKGFGVNSKSGTRFAIELPLSDTSAAATVALVAATLTALPAAARGATIVYADAATAAAARASGQARAWELQEACRQEQLSGLLLLVAPGAQDVALVEQLLEEVWVGPAAAALNPTWQAGAPGQYQGLVDSFDAVYSFLPISLQGLLRGKEGAVLREAPAGRSNSSSSGGSSQWRVLYQQPSGTFVQVGQMKTRPQQSDLELIFMNASAASSPLTSVVKGVKSLFSKSKS